MTETSTQLIITKTLRIPLSELRFSFVRSSGPGGQNVNKVNSQVQLAWNLSANESLPTDVRERLRDSQSGRISKAGHLRIDSQRFRDRERNRENCLEKLKSMILEVAQPPKKRRKTRVPRGANEKRLRLKQQRSSVKETRRRPRLDE